MSTKAARPRTNALTTAELIRRYGTIRARTEALAAPLPVEDQVMQTMLCVSPTRWHLAHTTWFFETFVLKRFADNYEEFDSRFGFLFNSYYHGVGERFERMHRGQLGRPRVSTILAYRAHVDEGIRGLLEYHSLTDEVSSLLELGLQHEQQHQELILTDIKHVLASNPLRPAYDPDCATFEQDADSADSVAPPCSWIPFSGGVYTLGHRGSTFCFDNEEPRHKVFIDAFELASRPVTCGEFTNFINDGGYEDSRWWLSDGWNCRQEHQWTAPAYWEERDQWWTMTLGGMRPVDPLEPVVHLSYFEADAYARWAGARLPTEAQWEIAAENVPIVGNFADTNRFHPQGVDSSRSAEPNQLFGNIWEWTASPYSAYPGFKPWNGVLGEYNGKFMCNQFVLRGGSCATAAEHIRRTYRNFFPPDARWQFSGLRLAH